MLCLDSIDGTNALTSPPGGWNFEAVNCLLDQIIAEFPRQLEREELGKSAEGRPIQMIRLGQGDKRVLAWSQMHGDEHTHTTVLLSLIRLLAGSPHHAASSAILQSCSLGLIPLLNPDGAERGSRFNAQGVDVNRDAQTLATPEGRLLNKAISQFQPEFAFNLHNQNHRRWLPSGKGPIALSLLVPPIDAEDSQTPNTTAARRIASKVCQAVKPHCEGLMSRYSASYMPRCFGEWAQSQGVATLLMEAGGREEENIRELEQLNLLALLAAMTAIADQTYETSDSSYYQNLPEAAGHEAFDLLVAGARVFHNLAIESTKADIGINRPNLTAMTRTPGTGVVADVGDLSQHSSFDHIDGAGLLCLPGKIGIEEGIFGPDSPPGELLFEEAVRHGLTTLLLPVETESEATINWLQEILSGPRPLLNVGFVGTVKQVSPGSPRLTTTAENELILGELPQDCEQIKAWRREISPQQWIEQTRSLACQWSLGSFHTIERGASANMAIVSSPVSSPVSTPASATDDLQTPSPDLQAVIVGGSIVLKEGVFCERHAGAWLHRESRVVARR